MTNCHQITAILKRYLSPVNAQAILERALGERKLRFGTLSVAELRSLREPLRRGIKLFARDLDCEKALSEISALCGAESVRPAGLGVVIASEGDISTIRNEARRICQDLGAKALIVQRVATIVSELARNISSYTTGGRIDITVETSPTRRVVVRASDNGPGIPNLAHIMSGQYRSRTGLGKGLLGTKRLADRFDISTGPTGTTVEVEVAI